MTRKRFFVVAALLLLPIAAMAGMTAISDTELQKVEGRTGFEIDIVGPGPWTDLNVTIGSVAWGDDDGFGTTLTSNAGWVIMSNIDMPSILFRHVYFDAGSTGTTSYLSILTLGNLVTGNLTIGDIVIGDTATASTESLGEIRAYGTAVYFGQILISGHD